MGLLEIYPERESYRRLFKNKEMKEHVPELVSAPTLVFFTLCHLPFTNYIRISNSNINWTSKSISISINNWNSNYNSRSNSNSTPNNNSSSNSNLTSYNKSISKLRSCKRSSYLSEKRIILMGFLRKIDCQYSL